jgi:PIN domain nuclease of toxin-antitoxin system
MKSRRLLLDTQAFILAAQGDKSLSRKVAAILLHTDTTAYLSLVSLWEMQFKLSLGKLRLPVALPEAIQRAVTDIGLEILPLQAEHIYKLASLPFHHRDLFDRLLIAQALYEQMPIATNDRAFDAYGISRLW